MPAIRDISTILNAVLVDAPRGKYEETLQRRAKPGTRIVFKTNRKSRDASYAIQQLIRIKAANSARFVRPYEGFGASVDNYDVKVVMDYATIADKIPFNAIEDKINSGTTKTKVISIYDMRRSAFYEGMCNLLESSIWREPGSLADRDKALCGFPYWFRRSMDSAGTAVADTDGGFNGQYIAYGDGTISSLLGIGSAASATSGTVDASLPGNAGVRNWNATYSGTFDVLAWRTVRRALMRTQFEMGDEELKGDLDHGGKQRLAMPEDQYEQYMDLVNNSSQGPDAGDGDLTKFKSYKLHGCSLTPVPELNAFSYQPIYGFKESHLEGNVLTDEWMREHKAITDPFDPFTAYVTISAMAQMNVLNPRNAGFVVSKV
jgi:hypothetical protein